MKAKEKVRAGLTGEDEKVATQLNAAEEKKEEETVAPRKKKGFFARRKAKAESDKKDKEKEAEAAALPPVGFTALFRYATKFELFLNALGLFLAAAAGATQPLMTLIFGRLANSFTEFGVIQADIQANGLTAESIVRLQDAQAALKRDSGHNALYLLAIGIGMFLATYAYMLICKSSRDRAYTRELYRRDWQQAAERGVPSRGAQAGNRVL
jgi:ATP-binding cassette subfamily B (MDR/TAP) protein 1